MHNVAKPVIMYLPQIYHIIIIRFIHANPQQNASGSIVSSSLLPKGRIFIGKPRK